MSTKNADDFCPYCSSENVKVSFHSTQGWHDNACRSCQKDWHVIDEGKNIGKAVPIEIEVQWDEDWFAAEYIT